MASRYASRQRPSASSSPAPPRRSIPTAHPVSTASPHLLELRRQWKWAAVSQFLYTFAQLVALDDVHLVVCIDLSVPFIKVGNAYVAVIKDVEEDLVNSTMIVIPRLMQRLLITLTQDRKISVDNWQSALRRQYLKRDHAANPLGVEPPTVRNSRAATVETEIKSEGRDSALPDDSLPTGIYEGEGSPDEYDGKGASEKSVGTPLNEGPSDERRVLADNSVKEEDEEVAQKAQNPVNDWSTLSMLEKLDSIHTVIEWHFQSPLRLRSVMRSDDETASWRIEPIGYDAKRNAYWFIGADRLWIQRVPPKPPKKATKRKATSNVDARKAKVARVDRADDGKKKRSRETPKARDAPKQRQSRRPEGPKRSGRAVVDESPSSSSTATGRARAAKTQANVKLDLQAKQLAAAKAEMESLNRKSARKSPTKAPVERPVGIRISRRLRGGANDDDDDEWQPIPEEWLSKSERTEPRSAPLTTQATRSSARKKGPRAESKSVATTGRAKPAVLESDDESDLTELSDSETSVHEEISDGQEHVVEDPPLVRNGALARNREDVRDDVVPEPQLPADFVEWETVCVSLQEWEEISHRFEKATHYLEKALHKVLSQEIVPFVTESLREAERQRLKEDALMNRKRSSRIAVREMEKETARLEAIRKAEEEEKMARLRRLETRSRREEEERLKREQARDQRRKEREERELARARRLERAGTEEDVDVLSEDLPDGVPVAAEEKTGHGHSEASKPVRRRSKKKSSQNSTENETWELDCEICGSKGINKDDGIPLMSCGKCNKWQHIPCHDAVDRKAGRALRNWDAVDFFCRKCRELQFGRVVTPQLPPHLQGARAVNGQGHPVGRYSPGYGAPGLANGIKPGQGYNNPPPFQQSAGTIPPATFAHYHTQSSGFAPGPSVPHYQYHPSLNSSISQPMFTHGSPPPWNSGSHGYSLDSRGGGQPVLAQNGVTNGHGASTPFSYGMPLGSASGNAHPQNVQRQHQHFPPSEQRILNNPAYQPQL